MLKGGDCATLNYIRIDTYCFFRDKGLMELFNKLSLFLIITTLFITSWLLGGHHYAFPYISTFLLVSSLLLILLRLFIGKKSESINIYVLCSVILLILHIFCGLFLNNSFKEVIGPFESFYQFQNPLSFIPSGLYSNEALTNMTILFSAIFVGFLSFYGFNDRRMIRFVFWLIFANVLVLAVIGTFYKITNAQHILGKFQAPDPRYFFASFTYKNHWSAYATLAFIGSFGLPIYYHRNRRRWNLKNSPIGIFLSLGFLIGITTLISGSRSGLILFSIGYSLAVWVSVKILTENYVYNAPKMNLALRIVLTVLPIPLIMGAVYVVSPNLLLEPLKITQGQIRNAIQNDQWESRFYTSRDTFKMFAAKPLWGWGYDSYPIIFRKYFQGRELSEKYNLDENIRNRYEIADEDFKADPSALNRMKLEGSRAEIELLHFKYAHNDILQYLAELGVFGFLFLLSPVIYGLFLLFKTNHISSVSKWGLFSVLLIFIYSIVEFPTRTPGILYLMAIIFAISIKYSLIEQKDIKRSRSSDL
jgi:O-antigen ligase